VAAELMTKYASKVYWVFSEFTASENLVSAAKAAGAEMIEASIVKISGETRVTSVTLSDGKEIPVNGVFLELGGRSSADLAMDIDLMPEIDDSLKVDRSCATAVPGVFACGDVTGRPWQVAKAVGEGAVAGLSAADYSKNMIQ
jgi:thioredoxin reductase (NADPH)